MAVKGSVLTNDNFTGSSPVLRRSTAAGSSIRVHDLPGSESELSARTDLEGCHRSPRFSETTGGAADEWEVHALFHLEGRSRRWAKPDAPGSAPALGCRFPRPRGKPAWHEILRNFRDLGWHRGAGCEGASRNTRGRVCSPNSGVRVQAARSHTPHARGCAWS